MINSLVHACINGAIIYFKAKDVALTLVYVNEVKSIRCHVDEEFQVKLSDICTKGGSDMGLMELNRSDNRIYVTEPDLYQLTFKSQMPAAQEFSKWVAEEVLSLIHISGTYAESFFCNAVDFL